jgi:signal transduction histidine kinase
MTLAAQLTPAQQARRRYDELRHELLTLLNHELRTPLMTLSAGWELLQDLADVGQLPAMAQTMLARMETSIERLITLSANVTVLGDVATAHSRLDAASFDPPEVVQVLRSCVSATPETSAARVRLHVVPDDLRIAMPEGALRELLDRVLDNALKFTDPCQAIDVDVAARSSHVTIAVHDNGIGIPAHENHGIGQPFFRASNARENEAQGAGLGLAAATTIARQWGGTVDLASTENVGTTVTLTLPRAELPRASP